jgi:AraC family transcriptional regulator
MGNRTIHLFVFDGYADWEPSYAIAQLGNAFRVVTVAAAPAPVTTAGGLRIAPDLTLDQALPAHSALLILPDGEAWENGGNRESAWRAKAFLDAGTPVAALGRAGLCLARLGVVGFARDIRATLQMAPRPQPAFRKRPAKPDELRALVWSDPPGVTESPASRKTIVSIHMGASVHIGCRRSGQYHCGLSVHGDIDVIPPDTPSRWELREKDTSFIMRVPAGFLNLVADESGVDPARVEIVNRFQMRDPQMEHIGWALKAEMEAGYSSGRLFMDSLGTAMAVCLFDRHSSVARVARTHTQGMAGHRLRQVLSHIEYNLGRELSLKEIAGVAGVSISHCNAAFRKAVGMPVHQYVIQRRVEHAKTLLGEGRLSISQIAIETGFAHQSHLAYHVRRLLGVSPLSLRETRQRNTMTAS